MINKKIQEALTIMGYHTLTPIQEMVIPHLLEEKNVAVQSRTGSGKTASFAIPICEKITWEENKPQAIILTCTRELAQQVKQEVQQIGRLKKIKVQAIYGKESMQNQASLLKQKCHIVVATPGRLLDHIEQGSIDLSKVRFVVLDEADYMMDMGFIEQVDAILDELDQEVCMAMFSATYPERILRLIDKRMSDHEVLMIDEKAEIKHCFTYVKDKDKAFLQSLLSLDIESALVFCEKQIDVDELYTLCCINKIKVAKLHGGMLQEKRFQALRNFKEGKVRILIATDVAARGIDIDKVTHVIHYQVPHTIEEYTHRCGRSARKDLSGMSLLLLEEEDQGFFNRFKHAFPFETWDAKQCYTTYAYLNTPIAKTNIEKNWKDTIVKLYISAGKEKKIRAQDILGAFCSIDGIEKEDIGIVEVLQKMSYVEILHGKEKIIVEAFKNKTIKNKMVRVQVAKS